LTQWKDGTGVIDDQRYLRQVSLDRFGEEGQARLRRATVGLVGLGGLGSVSAQYLCAAGVGRLVMFDFEVVEESNLNRQILHGTSDLGRRKIDSARGRLADLNPECELVFHDARVDSSNAVDLLRGADVLVDATDNLETRLAMNRASLALGVPFVFGGVDGLGGMAAVFEPGVTGCLECLFSAPPVERDAPGVIGPAPGVIGSLQALETIRLLVGMPSALAGKLLVFDGVGMSFRTIGLERNPECAACGSEVGGTNG